MSDPAIPVTGDPEADALVATDPFALLLGMLLDQQVPMEWAFRGPSTLRQRMGGHLDARTLAAADPETVEAAFRQKPALHRYPAAMAKRGHALAVHLVEHHDGDASALWRDTDDADTVRDRLRDLPGYGEEKARILLAVLVKRLGVPLRGWERAAAPFSDDHPRSVADIDSFEALERVRAFKKAQKAAGRSKRDPA